MCFRSYLLEVSSHSYNLAEVVVVGLHGAPQHMNGPFPGRVDYTCVGPVQTNGVPVALLDGVTLSALAFLVYVPTVEAGRRQYWVFVKGDWGNPFLTPVDLPMASDGAAASASPGFATVLACACRPISSGTYVIWK